MADEKRGPGRPTEFKPEYTQMLIDYFGVAPYKRELKELDVTEDGEEIRKYGEPVPSDFPSLAGFAVKVGVHRDTLHEWANAVNEDASLKYPEFSDAYKRAKDFQENYLIVNGSKSLINTAFGIFIAKNVLGWRDRQKDETDSVNVNVNNHYDKMSDTDLAKRRAELEAKFSKKKAAGDGDGEA